jgi:hypothetical protein
MPTPSHQLGEAQNVSPNIVSGPQLLLHVLLSALQARLFGHGPGVPAAQEPEPLQALAGVSVDPDEGHDAAAPHVVLLVG